MGVLNKLYLRFPKAFWAEEPEFLDYISNRKGEWTEWLNIYHYTGQPILVGFNAGRYGRQIEKLTDQEMVKAAMGTLRTIYGDVYSRPGSLADHSLGRRPLCRRFLFLPAAPRKP